MNIVSREITVTKSSQDNKYIEYHYTISGIVMNLNEFAYDLIEHIYEYFRIENYESKLVDVGKLKLKLVNVEKLKLTLIIFDYRKNLEEIENCIQQYLDMY